MSSSIEIKKQEVASIKEKIENGTNPEDIAFIATNKDELAEMASLLAEEGVPTRKIDKEKIEVMFNSATNLNDRLEDERSKSIAKTAGKNYINEVKV